MTMDLSPGGIASLYQDLGRELSTPGTRLDAVAAITRLAVGRVPGTEWASISEGRAGSFVTTAATHEAACEVDRIQYELGAGPCVDAIVQDAVFRTDDLRTDERWPDFSRRVAETSPVRSMLSFRIFLEDDERIAGLNLYSTATAGFDDHSELIGTLMATHGALTVQAAAAREQVAQLERALATSRDIGTAMGVLMTRHKITRAQAFELLRLASQNTNRKLAEIAADVADTGTLDLPTVRPTRRRTAPRAR